MRLADPRITSDLMQKVSTPSNVHLIYEESTLTEATA